MKKIIVALAAAVVVVFALLVQSASAQEDVPAEVSNIVDVLFAGDEAAVRDLLVLTQVECQGSPALDYTFPECAEGVEEGTLVDGFPSTGCEGAYVTEDQFDEVAELLSESGAELVGVYQASPDQIGLMYGDYVAVYTGIGGRPVPGGVWLTAEGVTGVNGGCPSPGSPIGTLAGFEERFGLVGPISEDPSDLPDTGQGHASERGFGWPPGLSAALATAGALLLGGGGAFALVRRWAQ